MQLLRKQNPWVFENIFTVCRGPIDTPLMAGSLKDFERVLGAPW